MSDHHEHLPRLEPEFYRGQAYVHWTMTIDGRKTGWLKPLFLYKFREILAHTLFRYALACPIFCLMPDHVHLVLIGIDDRSDQLKATKYLRKHVGEALGRIGFQFQHQPYDRVLRDDERLEGNFIELIEYIARNPERAGLIEPDTFASYKYSGCLLPGYPEMRLWDDQHWERFWRAYSFLRKNGLFRPAEENFS